MEQNNFFPDNFVIASTMPTTEGLCRLHVYDRSVCPETLWSDKEALLHYLHGWNVMLRDVLIDIEDAEISPVSYFCLMNTIMQFFMEIPEEIRNDRAFCLNALENTPAVLPAIDKAMVTDAAFREDVEKVAPGIFQGKYEGKYE